MKRSYCLCISLRTSCIIIAIISIIYPLFFVREAIIYGDRSNRIRLTCVSHKTISYYQYDDTSTPIDTIVFGYYVPLLFSDLIGHVFIFIHLICSGLMLGGAIMSEKSSLLPWLYFVTICTCLHVGSAIKELTKLTSLTCPVEDLITTIIYISLIYLLEILLVILVYSYYKKLDNEIIADESDESVIKNDVNQTNNDANMIPEVVTCTVLNQMTYICEPII